ncbi:hypothetical protein MASR2M17_17200 [Aminivibrio sp.]
MKKVERNADIVRTLLIFIKHSHRKAVAHALLTKKETTGLLFVTTVDKSGVMPAHITSFSAIFWLQLLRI